MRFNAGSGALLFEDDSEPHDLLFDVQADPLQEHPIVDPTPEQVGGLKAQLIRLMEENDAPQELYTRLRLK